ncbi:MAG: M20/M25/M40 family metallo-hydrolase [Planctomycetaceae bacterium]|nr:M20/M25/M40 family metallo-hydrolase [Planctomycetaceae bacterium]
MADEAENEDQLFNRLAELTSLAGPSGFEEPVLRAMRSELEPLCDSVEVDIRGNVCGQQNAAGSAASAEEPPLRIMLTAHADQIGFLITSILRKGFLRFTRIGGPTLMVLPGQQVQVLTEQGPLEGVIGVRPGHVIRSADEARQVPALEDLYIDIGAESAGEAAEWGVRQGTPAVFAGELVRTRHPRRCFGPSVDNRMGCLVVAEVARRLQGEQLSSTRLYSIVVEEEIGLRGAAVAAQSLQPDVVLAIDTVPAGGTPDLRPDALPWEIGGGPLIKVRETRGLATHNRLRQLILQTAREQDLPVQLIVDTAGATDATSAQQASGAVAAGVIGLARRYSHSAVEMFDLGDLSAIIDLTTAVIRGLHSREQLRRI